MNKTELIAAVAEEATISEKDAENAVSAVIASITESLAGGEKVQIAGFGTFEVRERGERVGRDPRTSAEIGDRLPRLRHSRPLGPRRICQ